MDLTEKQIVKRELQQLVGKKTRVSEKEVADVIREKNLKKLSSNFRATEREQLQHINRNKTEPPDVGKYSPNMSLVSPRSGVTNFQKQMEYSK